MDDKFAWAGALVVGVLVTLTGCHTARDGGFRDSQTHFESVLTRIEYPDVEVEPRQGVVDTPPPRTVRNAANLDYWPISLEESVRMALCNSRVMRDIGGTVINAPAAAVTVFDPAIRDTDPRSGVEAALSLFDAQLATGIFWSKYDRYYNNIFIGAGRRAFLANTADFKAEISKVAATGTELTLRNITDFERDNALLNQFPQSYGTVFEGEIRQPLLQGAGIEFNRIAGPGAKPGNCNGVVLARINTDVTLADFETAVRDLLGNVERAYWDLYVAYRDLDARSTGRDAALQTWRQIERKFGAGMTDHEQEARAREQYYAFDAQVINTLTGVAAPGSPGVAAGGVYAAERRLRWLLGLPASDGRILRPSEEPSTVPLVFDWGQSLQESLCRRSELRRQKWIIKRRELELVAAKNFLRMRLDAVGQYRFRGTGEDLFGNRDVPHGSAFEDLFTGHSQEWEFGLQLSTPIGNRIGHTSVQNAEYVLSRERAVYHEQELRVTHELSEAMAELDRAYAATRAVFNARLAAHQQLDEIRKKYEAGVSPLEFLLEAQRRSVEADSTYYRSVVDYNLAVVNIHRARGSLLDYHNVTLNEGPSSEEAARSAAKQARRFKPRVLNYSFESPPAVTASPADSAQTMQPGLMGPVGGSNAASLPMAPTPPESRLKQSPAVAAMQDTPAAEIPGR